MGEREGTVLLVEDFEAIHRVVRHRLDRYAVISAFSCAQGRRAFEEHGVDAVLLDVNLPDGSGLVLLKQLRKVNETVPVLMFSSDFRAELIRRAVDAGASGFLAKEAGMLALLPALVAAHVQS